MRRSHGSSQREPARSSRWQSLRSSRSPESIDRSDRPTLWRTIGRMERTIEAIIWKPRITVNCPRRLTPRLKSPLATMYKRRLAELVYKVVKNLVPDELTNLFRRKTTTYRLRREQSLALLRPETNVLRDSIAYRGALLWNTLPKHITTAEGIRTIKRILKKYDFKSFTFDKLVTLLTNKDETYKYF